jgi:hypothetical protein
MAFQKRILFNFTYVILVFSLALKASLICISVADASLLNYLKTSYSCFDDQNNDNPELLNEVIILESAEGNFDNHHVKSSSKCQRDYEPKYFNTNIVSSSQQYFPVKAICSNTGIFLCLRL